MRRLANILATVGGGIVVGILFGYFLGFTHGTATAENSSPPPEAFDYPFGILVGLIVVAVARVAGPLVWRSAHRRSRSDG